MKVSYYTLGCKVNQYETEKIRALAEKKGFETVPFNEGGDVFVINTCTVTSVADGKSRAVIRKAKKINPSAFVIVTGCYSETHREEVLALSEADLITDIKDKMNIPDYIEKYMKEKNIISGENQPAKKTGLRMRTRAVVKVQDGCSQFCSYCLIPFARRARYCAPVCDVIDEIKELCDNNYKEIVLTGIRLGSYNDGGVGLSGLIENILLKTEIERVRLSSIEMWETDDRLIDLMKDGRMCSHLHIPLQSGNDNVLKLMNRPYNREEYYSLVCRLREKIPNLGLTTDIIAGFPGESDEYFEDSRAFIEKIGFSRLHVFKYSRRPGTVADGMSGHTDPETKKERVMKLTALGSRLKQKFAEKYVGECVNTLFEIKKKDGFTYGYTGNYIETRTERPVNRGETASFKVIKAENGILTV